MADNVIDSLKIAIELDPSKFKIGQDALNKSFRDTSDQAKRTGDELESRGAQGAEFFNQITSAALKLGTVLLGGVGLKDFIASSTKAGAALGYASRGIGISTQELTKYGNLVLQTGGNVDDLAASFQNMSQALVDYQINPKAHTDLASAYTYLGAYGVEYFDKATGKAKTFGQLLPDILKSLQTLSKQPGGIPLALDIAGKIGVYSKLSDAIFSPNFKHMEESAERIGAATDKQIAELEKLTAAYGVFRGTIETKGKEAIGGGLVALDEFAAEKKAHPFFPGFSKAPETAPSIAEPPGWWDRFKAAVPSLESIRNFGKIGPSTPSAPTAAAPRAPTAPVPTAAAPRAPTAPVPTAAAPRAPTAPAPTAAAPGAPAAIPLAYIFGLIQKLEGGKENSITPTGNAADPYAYGKNQITLGTALRYDHNATAAKLLDATYNDLLARKIEADYLARYGNNPDAIAIAYHNGPEAADKFVETGSTAGIAGFGPQSQAYLDRERALTGQTNTATTNISINTLNVNAPKATDAKGVASGINQALIDVNKSNTGPF